MLAITLTSLVAVLAKASQYPRSEQRCLSQTDADLISGRLGDILSKRDSGIGNNSETAEAIVGGH